MWLFCIFGEIFSPTGRSAANNWANLSQSCPKMIHELLYGDINSVFILVKAPFLINAPSYVLWGKGGQKLPQNGFRKIRTLKFCTFEPHDKTNRMSVCPAKTQISLGIRPVWSESSLCAQWVTKYPMLLHADSEDSNQTWRTPRLIWVFAGRTCHFVGFVMAQLIWLHFVLIISFSGFRIAAPRVIY